MEKIRIGTRSSKLALWQAEYIANLLNKGGLETELVTMETIGDLKLDVSIAKIGSKGVFTEELEDALRQGECDIAVHSAKDMPSELPEGFKLLAFTRREQVNDVLVSHKNDVNIANEDLIIGTSSTRRVAMLQHFYPHVKTVPVRGNLQTRVRKMEEGQCDALMLAFAGVHRMHFNHMIVKHFDLDQFTPATGQGSVTVEIHENLDASKAQMIKKLVNDKEAEIELSAERAFLKKLQGGCSIPVFCLARKRDDNMKITGGVIALDGTRVVRHNIDGPITEAASLGERLASMVLEDGGREILADIKKNLK